MFAIIPTMTKETNIKQRYLERQTEATTRANRDRTSRALIDKSIKNENDRLQKKATNKIMRRVGALTLATGLVAGPAFNSMLGLLPGRDNNPAPASTESQPDGHKITVNEQNSPVFHINIDKPGKSIYSEVDEQFEGDPRPIVDEIVTSRDGNSTVHVGEQFTYQPKK